MRHSLPARRCAPMSVRSPARCSVALRMVLTAPRILQLGTLRCRDGINGAAYTPPRVASAVASECERSASSDGGSASRAIGDFACDLEFWYLGKADCLWRTGFWYIGKADCLWRWGLVARVFGLCACVGIGAPVWGRRGCALRAHG